MRLLGKTGKKIDHQPAQLLDESPIKSPAEPSELVATSGPEPPTEFPTLCPKCESSFYWQDIMGRVHCQHCELVPSVRMVKDFWKVRCEQFDGHWRGVAWVHWDPFAPHKFGYKCKVFEHLERQQQAQAAAAAKAKPAEIF